MMSYRIEAPYLRKWPSHKLDFQNPNTKRTSATNEREKLGGTPHCEFYR